MCIVGCMYIPHLLPCENDHMSTASIDHSQAHILDVLKAPEGLMGVTCAQCSRRALS